MKAYILSLLNRIEGGFPSSRQRQEFPLDFLRTSIHSIVTREQQYSGIKAQIVPRKSTLADFSLAKHTYSKKFSRKLK